MWVLGDDPGEVGVIPLGSYLHKVFKNLSPTQDPNCRFFQGFDVPFSLFQKQMKAELRRASAPLRDSSWEGLSWISKV